MAHPRVSYEECPRLQATPTHSCAGPAPLDRKHTLTGQPLPVRTHSVDSFHPTAQGENILDNSPGVPAIWGRWPSR